MATVGGEAAAAVQLALARVHQWHAAEAQRGRQQAVSPARRRRVEPPAALHGAPMPFPVLHALLRDAVVVWLRPLVVRLRPLVVRLRPLVALATQAQPPTQVQAQGKSQAQEQARAQKVQAWVQAQAQALE